MGGLPARYGRTDPCGTRDGHAVRLVRHDYAARGPPVRLGGAPAGGNGRRGEMGGAVRGGRCARPALPLRNGPGHGAGRLLLRRIAVY
ncbi:hypothetical protein B6R96_34175 [Streptomyces sp. Sge12]|nr:hypothetical protein B6R96_34175 [Streptomyces sp. Sge12]